MRKLLDVLTPVFDIIFSPLVLIGAVFLYAVRKLGIEKMNLSKKIFMTTGVFPIRDHYYEPMFNPKHLRHSLKKDRSLAGIDLNIDEQLRYLSEINYSGELVKFPEEKDKTSNFYFNNGGFESGDAEYLYSMIRSFKPLKMIEIGSGNSTLMAINAIEKNKAEDGSYNCEHICIEPYEMKWLEEKNVKVIRSVVENVDKQMFMELKKNDILFIDSSHMIRPQGDVLYEILEILPVLKAGVFIHIHDIFTPRDYPEDWIINQVRFWNEQYLLEAFLSYNKDFRIIAALNFLKHNYFKQLTAVCPVLKKNVKAEPGSFWLVRN